MYTFSARSFLIPHDSLCSNLPYLQVSSRCLHPIALARASPELNPIRNDLQHGLAMDIRVIIYEVTLDEVACACEYAPGYTDIKCTGSFTPKFRVQVPFW